MVAILAILFAVMLYLGFQFTRWTIGIVPLSIFAPQFIVMAIIFRRTRQLRRAWAASGGRLCTHCGHDVSGLGEEGLCPECGCMFDIVRDRRSWAAAMAPPVRV